MGSPPDHVSIASCIARAQSTPLREFDFVIVAAPMHSLLLFRNHRLSST